MRRQSFCSIRTKSGARSETEPLARRERAAEESTPVAKGPRDFGRWPAAVKPTGWDCVGSHESARLARGNQPPARYIVIVKLVRKALPYSVALTLSALLAACALAPAAEGEDVAEGEDIAETRQALPVNEVRNFYYADETFTTTVGLSLRSCVPGPIVYSGKITEYFMQYEQRCPSGSGPLIVYECIDGFCTEF
jgi:hypothetical protein